MTAAGAGEKRRLEAADALCEVLSGLGTEHVFGLPGTQNMAFTEAVRRSAMRWVVPSNELAAAFVAIGYARSTGRTAVVNTIPGPGFTWALTGLAEARLDSTPLVLITGVDPASSGGGGLQEIPQRRMAEPVVKDALRVSSAARLRDRMERAFTTAVTGEPGPVLVEIEHTVWEETCSIGVDGSRVESGTGEGREATEPDALAEARRRVQSSDRPLLFVGQGAQDSAAELVEFAEALRAPVLVSTSGRGAMPESHPLALPLDGLRDSVKTANRLMEGADCILVLGCRLGHNATLGHRLELPPERLVRVDRSRRVFHEAHYPASVEVVGDVGDFLRTMLSSPGAVHGPEKSWLEERMPVAMEATAETEEVDEPRVDAVGSMKVFFRLLRRVLPDDGILVTDSGLHQMMARRLFSVEAPRSLIVPSNFQSMGYGLPAAIGARLANPDRSVVALIGDGGFRLSAFEIGTARKLDLDLGIVVFSDGHFGLIRKGQVDAYGAESGVTLPDLDLSRLSSALGAEYERLDEDPEEALRRCAAGDGTRVLEVGVSDPTGHGLRAAHRRLREEARRRLGPERAEALRDWIERWRRWTGGSAEGT